jgi:hypothetical protein
MGLVELIGGVATSNLRADINLINDVAGDEIDFLTTSLQTSTDSLQIQISSLTAGAPNITFNQTATEEKKLLFSLIALNYFKKLTFTPNNIPTANTLGNSITPSSSKRAYSFICNGKTYEGNAYPEEYSVFYDSTNKMVLRIYSVEPNLTTHNYMKFTEINISVWFSNLLQNDFFILPEFEKEILEGEECGLKDIITLLSFRKAFSK